MANGDTITSLSAKLEKITDRKSKEARELRRKLRALRKKNLKSPKATPAAEVEHPAVA